MEGGGGRGEGGGGVVITHAANQTFSLSFFKGRKGQKSHEVQSCIHKTLGSAQLRELRVS